ncbi:MAG: metal-dependent transcriptional regulator [Christensenellales bacterium]|jgi:DtxR family Mn-dependent transcriptional regulator
MQQNGQFRTLKGYQSLKSGGITETMEDYIEMIYRCSQQYTQVRVSTLASMLHVKPSSASKMIGKLKEAGLVHFEKYGPVTLSALGEDYGAYFLWRHNVLHRFFTFVNGVPPRLKQVEQIEHFIDEQTLLNLEALLDQLDEL